jgi:hypothetical protein
LRQYVVAKLAFGKGIMTTLEPNPVFILVESDPHMAMIHFHVGKNMVEDDDRWKI